MSTCGKCFFYEPGVTVTRTNPDGTKTDAPGGFCFGAPPSVQNNQVETPTVKEDRRQCAMWRAPPPKKGRSR